MNRLIAAAILLVIILASYIGGNLLVVNTINDATQLLESCTELFKDNGSAKIKAEELENFWSSKETLLSLFANHSSIDEIELAISSLKVYSNTENNEFFYEYVSKVRTLLNQLNEDSKATVHSIF